MTAKVKYHVGTYFGEIFVPCSKDDEEEAIIARAKRMISYKYPPCGVAYERWWVAAWNIPDEVIN